MEQPLFWSLLVGFAVLGAAVRLASSGPLVRRRAVPIGPVGLAVAAISSVVLAFHCAVMFFAPWTDAIPGAQPLGRVIRDLGTASQWSYWLPAAILLLALRRVWWPALVLLGATLVGVGITMFSTYSLATHLAWLAAAVLTLILVAVSLVDRPQGDQPPRTRAHQAV